MLPQKHPGHSSIRSGLPAGSAATERPAQRASPSLQVRGADASAARPGHPPTEKGERCLSESLVDRGKLASGAPAEIHMRGADQDAQIRGFDMPQIRMLHAYVHA